MRFVSARRRGVSVVLGALVLGACGSDAETTTAVVPVESTATPTTSTTAAPTSTTLPGIDADEFASQFRLSLDHLNEGFGEIADEFMERVTGGPDRIQLEVDLSRMQVELVDEAIEGLPKQPDDESLAALYEPMVAALMRWGDVAGETADDLEASEQELAAGWGVSGIGRAVRRDPTTPTDRVRRVHEHMPRSRITGARRHGRRGRLPWRSRARSGCRRIGGCTRRHRRRARACGRPRAEASIRRPDRRVGGR